jgi:hypothetical protein
MSWFDDLVSAGKSLLGTAVNFFTSNSLGANLAKTALLGYTLNRVNQSINKKNEPARSTQEQAAQVDPGVRIQVPPSSDYKVPVLYGSATFGGAITDAYLTPDNQNMYFVLTLCERTGNLLSTGSASTFTFNDVYLNDNRLVFQGDGITVDYMIDREGNQDISPRGLVQVYCYAGDSEQGVTPEYYSGSVPNAYTVMPNWDSTKQMTDTVFAIVKVTYTKDKGINGLPNMMFTVTNSMSLPGDCLYDLLTNERYGADIDASEINSS